MGEYYQRIGTLETHLKTKPELWNNTITLASAGPATTILMKTKAMQQSMLDAVKAWATTEGIGRELAMFKSKEQLKRMRERPLICTRNALSSQFGTRQAEGMRIVSSAHWPEHWCPDWAISSGAEILAWSETELESFKMQVYINAAHPLVNGQPGKIQIAMTEADIECAVALYICYFSAVPLGNANLVRGRGTEKGKGKGKPSKGGGRGPSAGVGS